MLVSCIMPTYNREQFIERSIACFLRQDYSDKELIIINDGNDISNIIPKANNIRLISLKEKTLLGEKRNVGIQASSGEYITMWDDDDWHASSRLTYQITELEKDPTKSICGLHKIYYHDIESNKIYLFSYPKGRECLIDGTALFRRSIYKPFPHKQVAATVAFVNTIPRVHQMLLDKPELYVATRHKNNTCFKKIFAPLWKETELKMEDLTHEG